MQAKTNTLFHFGKGVGINECSGYYGKPDEGPRT